MNHDVYANGKKRSVVPAVIITIVIISAVASLGAAGIYMTKNTAGVSKGGNVQINSDKYQAVFLTNGQVYFGKFADDGGNYIKLTDIYYLQAKDQTIQPKDSKETSEPELALIKLGKELHAPADEMNISRQQVLFWEAIGDDGKVMQAIKEYKASNK